jgi:hypothetical protein
MAKINLDQLADTILQDLDLYLANTVEDIEYAVKETAKDTVAELRQSSPADSGDYAESWNYKKDNTMRGKWYRSMVVYSKKPFYALTHLLERGHAKVNGGRVDARPHIKQAEDMAARLLYLRLVKALENRGSK